MNQKFGAITSSTNPEEIATKIKGLVVGASALIIILSAQFFHIQLSPNDIITYGSDLGMVGGAIAFVYGCGMHLLAFIFKNKQASA